MYEIYKMDKMYVRDIQDLCSAEALPVTLDGLHL